MNIINQSSDGDAPAKLIREAYDLLDPLWKRILEKLNFEVRLLDKKEIRKQAERKEKEPFFAITGADKNVYSVILGCFENVQGRIHQLSSRFSAAVLPEVVEGETGWLHLRWQVRFLQMLANVIFFECPELRLEIGEDRLAKLFFQDTLYKVTLKSKLDWDDLTDRWGDGIGRFERVQKVLKKKLKV